MYIVKNTTIFLIVRLLLLRYNYMFRPSILAIFRLYMKHLTISYIYTRVGGLQFVGWVRDLVLCLQKWCGSGLFRGCCQCFMYILKMANIGARNMQLYLSNSKRTIRNIVVVLTIYICTINLFLLFDNTTGMKHLKIPSTNRCYLIL